MMIEEWKDVVGWEEKYKVSTLGRVWNKFTDVEVAQVLTGIPQYKYVNMTHKGLKKLRRVHTLVAHAFIENDDPENKKFVDHIDRDKFNNNLSNLRWVTQSENKRNLDNTIIIDGLHIKDYVKNYDSPDAAYTYILSRTCKGMSIEQALEEYHEFIEYGLLKRKVVYEGKEHYLVDLAKEYSIEYDTLRDRIATGWNLWNALTSIPESYPHTVLLAGTKGVHHWYSSIEHFCATHNKSAQMVSRLIKDGKSFEEILEWDGKDHLRQTVLGVTGTIRELCAHFETTESAVSTAVLRKGLTLEQALTSPRQRVKRLCINGVYNSPKYWYESFGLNPKSANKRKSKLKLTFKETFESYGIDTSDMTVSVT